MQTSTLSLATSIPATTRSFCAIIQLPSLLGPGSKPMQLFGLRKTPDLSLAPRQALAAFEHERAQIQRRAVGENRPFAHSGRFCGHKSTKETVKTIACGESRSDPVEPVVHSCAFCAHDRGCDRHPAFPAPLCPENLSECANGRLDQNRPLLELSPLRPKATEPVTERGTAPVSSSTRTVARASSPNRARKGVDDGTK